MKNLYLIEFYTRNLETNVEGWEINFAWVYDVGALQAIGKLKARQGRRYHTWITCNQQTKIFPLAGDFRVNTPDANLFIYQ